MVLVRISFFKPDSYEYTWYVNTDDRGAAAKRVMREYDEKKLECLNYITTDNCIGDNPKIKTLELT